MGHQELQRWEWRDAIIPATRGEGIHQYHGCYGSSGAADCV